MLELVVFLLKTMRIKVVQEKTVIVVAVHTGVQSMDALVVRLHARLIAAITTSLPFIVLIYAIVNAKRVVQPVFV